MNLTKLRYELLNDAFAAGLVLVSLALYAYKNDDLYRYVVMTGVGYFCRGVGIMGKTKEEQTNASGS